MKAWVDDFCKEKKSEGEGGDTESSEKNLLSPKKAKLFNANEHEDDCKIGRSKSAHET